MNTLVKSCFVNCGIQKIIKEIDIHSLTLRVNFYIATLISFSMQILKNKCSKTKFCSQTTDQKKGDFHTSPNFGFIALAATLKL